MSYNDYKKMAQEFIQNAKDPKVKRSAENLKNILETEDGRQIAEDVTSQFSGQIDRAIEAAKSGNVNAAKAEISKIMSNPKGAALVSKIISMMQK